MSQTWSQVRSFCLGKKLIKTFDKRPVTFCVKMETLSRAPASALFSGLIYEQFFGNEVSGSFFFFATAQWFSGSKPSNQHEIIFSLVSISKVEFGNENLALVPI